MFAKATGLRADLKSKLEHLKNVVASVNGAVIAFSGGVDSSFLLKVTHEVLGDRAVAVTAMSDSYSCEELEEARRFAAELGVRHLIITTDEMSNPEYVRNSPMRCYYCKSELFQKLWSIAREEGVEAVFDGANADDASDYRPGMKAGAELGVRSPLLEAGLTKDEIREISKAMGLATWSKPSMACLASRIPYGVSITSERLKMVKLAEAGVRKLGFSQLRVRHHGEVARIEVPKREMAAVLERAEEVIHAVKGAGYIYVTLDLEGYRSGSMNELLSILNDRLPSS